jgi:uncharacterized membrane protein YczE
VQTACQLERVHVTLAVCLPSQSTVYLHCTALTFTVDSLMIIINQWLLQAVRANFECTWCTVAALLDSTDIAVELSCAVPEMAVQLS